MLDMVFRVFELEDISKETFDTEKLRGQRLKKKPDYPKSM